MNIDMQEIEKCKLLIHCELSSDEVNAKREDVIKIFKDAPVPGFRKGKADSKAIRQHYRKQVDDALQRALIEQAYHDVLFEKNIKVWGNPEVTGAYFVQNEFECDMVLYKKPDATLNQYKGFNLPKPAVKLSENDYVESLIQEFRVQQATSKPLSVGDAIADGDDATLDYTGTIDGQKVTELTAENSAFIIGRTSLSGFDNNLVGAVVGTPITFELKLPENIIPSLAGKVAEFNVVVTAASRKELCAVDDELAKKLGRDTLEVLRNDLRGVAASKIAERERSELLNNLHANILQNVTVDVPEWMITAELRYIIAGSGLNWNNMQDVDKKAYHDMAEKNVKLVLALEKVRESEPESQLSDEEVSATLRRILETSNPGVSVAEQVRELAKNGAYEVAISNIKNEYTLDFLLKNCTITE